MIDTLFPETAFILPQDGSVEIFKNYRYFPESDLHVGNSEPLRLGVVRLSRIDKETGLAKPLGLFPGCILQIPCFGGGYGVREVEHISGDIVKLKDRLNGTPLAGGQVRHIKGYAQWYIDMRIRDQIEKGKLTDIGGSYVNLNG